MLLFVTLWCICFLLLPALTIWLWVTKPSTEVLQSYESRFGALYSGMKTNSRTQLFYYLFYIGRRFAYMAIPLLMDREEDAIFQVLGIMFLNLASIIYLGQVRVFKTPVYNYFEAINEWFVAACTYHIVLFTEFVPSYEVQYSLGFSFIGMALIFVLVNFGLLITEMYHGARLISLKYYNRIKARIAVYQVQTESPTKQDLNTAQ